MPFPYWLIVRPVHGVAPCNSIKPDAETCHFHMAMRLSDATTQDQKLDSRSRCRAPDLEGEVVLSQNPFLKSLSEMCSLLTIVVS